MNRMRVVMVEPRKQAKVIWIDNTLEAMQELVGGYIETFQLDDEVFIVCNEEGKMGGYEPCRAIWHEGELIEIIFGTFFICAAPWDSENFAGLSEDQAKEFSELFKAAEYFVRTPEGIAVVKDV